MNFQLWLRATAAWIRRKMRKIFHCYTFIHQLRADVASSKNNLLSPV